jgi:hypothetical protein
MRKHWKIWKPQLEESDYETVIGCLSPYRLTFLGYGGSCLSFVDANLLVYKVCLKENNLVLQSKQAFLDHCRNLKEANINILSPIEFLMDNEHFLIYTQEFCNPLSYVNAKIVVETLKLVKTMLEHRYKLTDIYYRNLGIWKNQIVVYDYHDYKVFEQTDHTYICHLAHLFNLYYHNRVYQSIDIGIEDLVVDNFCYDNFAIPEIHQLLYSLYCLPVDNHSKEACQRSILIIEELIQIFMDANSVNHVNYQYLTINRDGILNLENHTLHKFQLANRIIKNLPQKFTAIDCGCSLGGIGNKIAQLYPNSHITLNNLTKSELETAQNICQHLCLNNVDFDDSNILTLQNRSFDLTMFFALLHHLLKDIPFTQLINFIYQMTNHYTVMDIPLKGDALLDMIMANGNLPYHESFIMLESVETFQEAIKDYFEVIVAERIEYGGSDLNRWGFILKKL